MAAGLLGEGRIHRGHLSLVAALGIVVAAVALASTLPESTRHLWFGKTVEHCPDMELSCPSHRPGLLFFPAGLAIVFLMLKEDDAG